MWPHATTETQPGSLATLLFHHFLTRSPSPQTEDSARMLRPGLATYHGFPHPRPRPLDGCESYKGSKPQELPLQLLQRLPQDVASIDDLPARPVCPRGVPGLSPGSEAGLVATGSPTDVGHLLSYLTSCPPVQASHTQGAAAPSKGAWGRHSRLGGSSLCAHPARCPGAADSG